MKINLKTIAKIVGGEIEGSSDVDISNICKIEEGEKGSIAFLSNPKYEKHLYATEASAVIIDEKLNLKEKVQPSLLRVKDPYQAFATLLQEYAKLKQVVKKGKDKKAYISRKARLGKGVYVGAFAYISEGARIGDETKIHPQAFIGKDVVIGENVIINSGAKILDGTVIGDNCNIYANAVIGSDGFGFAPLEEGGYMKIPQLGNVVIEENVEIGSNATIDRATMGSTIIRKGVKIDNLVQIAHNVEIGENTVIASQSGISGSVTIGKECMLGGQVGVSGHLKIGNKVKIQAQSGIISSISDGEIVMGSPAFSYRKYNKSYVYFKKLPEILKGK